MRTFSLSCTSYGFSNWVVSTSIITAHTEQLLCFLISAQLKGKTLYFVSQKERAVYHGERSMAAKHSWSPTEGAKLLLVAWCRLERSNLYNTQALPHDHPRLPVASPPKCPTTFHARGPRVQMVGVILHPHTTVSMLVTFCCWDKAPWPKATEGRVLLAYSPRELEFIVAGKGTVAGAGGWEITPQLHTRKAETENWKQSKAINPQSNPPLVLHFLWPGSTYWGRHNLPSGERVEVFKYMALWGEISHSNYRSQFNFFEFKVMLLNIHTLICVINTCVLDVQCIYL